MSVKKLCQHGSTDGPDSVFCKCWRPDKSSTLQPISPVSEGCCKELQEVLCLRNKESLLTGFDGSYVHAAVTHSWLTLVRYLASLTFPNLERDDSGGRKSLQPQHPGHRHLPGRDEGNDKSKSTDVGWRNHPGRDVGSPHSRKQLWGKAEGL